MTKENNQALGELVRDLTKVGSISKSEAKRRIQEYVQSEISLLKKGIEADLEKLTTIPFGSENYWIKQPEAINIVRKAGE